MDYITNSKIINDICEYKILQHIAKLVKEDKFEEALLWHEKLVKLFNNINNEADEFITELNINK